jgi:hypothetical protein
MSIARPEEKEEYEGRKGDGGRVWTRTLSSTRKELEEIVYK